MAVASWLFTGYSAITAVARCPVRADAEVTITVEGLVQDFPTDRGGKFRAVEGVSFTVARGSTQALVGESGSGKTTTARAVVGFQQPDAAIVTVNGQDVTTPSGEALPGSGARSSSSTRTSSPRSTRASACATSSRSRC